MSETNRTLVTEFLAVFSTGDADAIADRLHDDATWWVSGSIEGMSGTHTREEMRTLLSGVTTVYKEGALRVTPVAMIAEGDRVLVETEAYAELTDGRVYQPTSAWVFAIADGKVAQIREYLDTHHVHAIFFAP